jgi:uncharacterized protein (TIGR03067 family)
MSDNDRIQGTWALVSGERYGQAFSNQVIETVTLEFSGDNLSTKTKDRVNKATFKLHPECTPKGIDLDMGGTVGMGIYRLDGDALTILHGEVGDKRPTRFDAKETPRLTLLVLRRSAAEQG